MRRYFSSAPPSPQNKVGIFKAYGRPVATIFMWSAITYMGLQLAWNKLYNDELRLETEKKIESMKAQIKD